MQGVGCKVTSASDHTFQTLKKILVKRSLVLKLYIQLLLKPVN
jgi:hypothetical protein